MVQFCSNPGILNITDLVSYMFEQLDMKLLSNRSCWVNDPINRNQSGPSEKLYQANIYGILCALCVSDSCWTPLYETKASTGKVDLGLEYFDTMTRTKHKYIIELGCNEQSTGAESHYKRQDTVYAQEPGIRASILILIYTNEHPKAGLYWPTHYSDNVIYYVAQHLILSTPHQVMLYQKQKEVKKIMIGV